MSLGTNGNSETKVKTDIKVYCDADLKNLLADLADEAGMPLSDFIVEKLAKLVGRKDLAKIPRKKMGRPITRNGKAAAL